MELEAFTVDEEERSVVDVIVGADSFFAIVLQVGLETLQLSGNYLNDLVRGEAVELQTVETFGERLHLALVNEVDEGVAEVCVRFVVHWKIEKIKLVVETGILDLCQQFRLCVPIGDVSNHQSRHLVNDSTARSCKRRLLIASGVQSQLVVVDSSRGSSVVMH